MGEIVQVMGADSLHRAAGIAGVAFYLGSYSMLLAGLLRGSGYAYASLNLVAAVLVLFSLSREFNLASALIQISWIAISVFGLVRIFLLNHGVRFNDEEESLRRDAFDAMPRPLVRKLLNRAIWSDCEPGRALTREGEPVTHLHYLHTGLADILSGGRQIARLRNGLIGEMNVMAGGPASATVRLAERGRVCTISGDALRKLAANDAEMRLFLEQTLNDATKRKLVEANARLADPGSHG